MISLNSYARWCHYQADFHGGNAKLIWPVSLNGKKMGTETHKILGILDKPKSD